MLVACLAGLATGLVGGFFKILLPFIFLLAGVAVAGTISNAVGPALPEVLGDDHSQTAVVFLVVLAALQAAGFMLSGILSLAMMAASAAVSATPMGALFNRAGGAVAGLLYGCVFVSVFLIALQQIPVESVAEAIGDSSFAHRPIGWVDKYAPSIEISQ